MALVCIVLGKRHGDGSTDILPMGHESDRYSSQASNVSLVNWPICVLCLMILWQALKHFPKDILS